MRMWKSFTNVSCLIFWGIVVFCSCQSRVENKQQQLQEHGYEVVAGDDYLWYYTEDSVYFYDADQDEATCVLALGQMMDGYYLIKPDFDAEGRLFIDCKKYDEPVLFDKGWTMYDTPMDSSVVEAGIKFAGRKGFAYLSVEEEMGERYEYIMLYSAVHPHCVYQLDGKAGFEGSKDEIHLTLSGKLYAQKPFNDKELSDAVFNNYGRLATFTWDVVVNYDGEVVKKANGIFLDKIGASIPVSAVGTPELETRLLDYKQEIMQKDFELRAQELASRACDIYALNDLFRNPRKAQQDVVGVWQVVVGEVTRVNTSLLGHDWLEMRTNDRNLDVSIYTSDLNFFDLKLPATILFRGKVSALSSFNNLIFEDCVFEAVSQAPVQTERRKDGLDVSMNM